MNRDAAVSLSASIVFLGACILVAGGVMAEGDAGRIVAAVGGLIAAIVGATWVVHVSRLERHVDPPS